MMMEINHKVLITEQGDFGIIMIEPDGSIGIYTSSKPELYGKDITIEELMNYFEDLSQGSFNWVRDVPSDWRLVGCSLTINE